MDFNLQEPPAARFYRAFEDKHRGTREIVKQRLSVYLPYLVPLTQIYPDLPVLDLGCGRGEWLELLQSRQLAAHGVDLDEGMLAGCRELGLNVSNAEALAHLASLPDRSQLAVTGFHIAEHLPFAALQALFAQALRVLAPGGLLILETPNPENLVVGSASFYIDPTHQRPLPSQLLSFLAEFHGFGRVKLLRLQEEERLGDQDQALSLYDVLGRVSPDYAIVAQAGPAMDLPALDALFAVEWGVSLFTLASRYDEHHQAHTEQLRSHVMQLQAHAQQSGLQTEGLQHQIHQLRDLYAAQLQATQAALQQTENALDLARQNAARADQLGAALNAVHASRSWRITRPLRWLAERFRSGSGGV